MIEITRDLKDILICALRYSLGRRTYITSLTSEYIMGHSELIDERVKEVMIRDLIDYFAFRQIGTYVDDECDYQSWLKLEKWLYELEVGE